HDLDHHAQVRDQANVPLPVIREMDVLLTTTPRGIALGHVLAHDLDRPRAPAAERAEAPGRRRAAAARTARPAAQCVRAPDRRRLLSEGAVQAADHFVLTIEMREDLLDLARELEVVVDLEQLLAGQSGHDHAARRHPRLSGHRLIADPVEPSVPAAIRRHYGQPPEGRQATRRGAGRAVSRPEGARSPAGVPRSATCTVARSAAATA